VKVQTMSASPPSAAGISVRTSCPVTASTVTSEGSIPVHDTPSSAQSSGTDSVTVTVSPVRTSPVVESSAVAVGWSAKLWSSQAEPVVVESDVKPNAGTVLGAPSTVLTMVSERICSSEP
jgi:hypothetical protein